MHVLTMALQVAGLFVDEPSPSSVPSTGSSAIAQIITVTLAGIAAIITAAAGYNNLRKRRQAEADAAGPDIVVPVDLEDRPSRLRERLTALETRANAHDREIDDLKESMVLRRAADIALEAEQAPRRRRRTPE